MAKPFSIPRETAIRPCSQPSAPKSQAGTSISRTPCWRYARAKAG
jgi:hypothetical protein